MTTNISKTFLVTGVSSGLGRAFAEGALDAGHRVIGTVRRAADAEAFAALAPDRAHPLVLDVTDFDAIPAAVANAERQVDAIDVLVNNAGYGHEVCWRNPPLTIYSGSSRRTCSVRWR